MTRLSRQWADMLAHPERYPDHIVLKCRTALGHVRAAVENDTQTMGGRRDDHTDDEHPVDERSWWHW